MAVAFDYSLWSVRYPELSASVGPTLAQLYFNEAGLYCDNSDASPISDDSVGGERSMFLNMLTAHIAALNASINGQPSSPLVGRVSSATQGSVSVSTDNQYLPGSVQWYQQTKYGAAFWAATAKYRTFFYVCGHPRTVDPYQSQYINGAYS